jgi:cell division septation protein DedD
MEILKATRSIGSPGKWRACGLVVLFAFILTSVLVAPRSASALRLGTERKDTLCGKLVFLENAKTGEKLIGLAPCGQTKPYIFDYRPNELHDYYRLQDVVIRTGPAVPTINFGTITTYITHFSVSSAIQDCNDCKISAPTWTPHPEQASLNCANWIIQISAGLAAAQAGAQALELSQGDKIRYQIGEYNNSPELSEKCGADEICRAQAISIRLGSLLGGIFQHNQLPVEHLISLLKKLLSEPEGAKYCQPDSQGVWSLVIGLDQQGYPIQALQVVTPATQLLEDAAGRRTGILEDGTLREEIPGSALVVAGRTKYTLLVAGSAAKISVRGNDNGTLSLQLVDFSGPNVLLARFDQPALTDKTRLELDPAGGQPVLQVAGQGDGNIQLVKPAKTETYPILQAWLPTLTPGVLPTRTTTATTEVQPSATTGPSATATSEPTPTQLPPTVLPTATAASGRSFPNPCASAGGLAALTGIGWWLNKKR